MQNGENHFYISDENTICEKHGNIEHFHSIETDKEVDIFASNHELLALGYKVGDTKHNVGTGKISRK